MKKQCSGNLAAMKKVPRGHGEQDKEGVKPAPLMESGTAGMGKYNAYYLYFIWPMCTANSNPQV